MAEQPAYPYETRLNEYHWHKHDTDDEFFYMVENATIVPTGN